VHLAALTLLLGPLTAPAMAAGTAVWLRGTIDPTAVGGATHIVAVQAASPANWAESDGRAIENLRSELNAVRPLLDVFDGELQVLRRLELALDAVQVIRAEDRVLIHEARAFQGLAAWRYFQDTLATDPEAASVRVALPDGAGGTTQANRAWVNAIAIDPDTMPSAQLLPDADARLAYQELRAQLMIAPGATIIAVALPDGGRLIVDGEPSMGDHARLIPGEHRAIIECPDGTRLRHRLQMDAGAQVTLVTPASAAELSAFADSLDGVSAVALPPRVAAAFDRLDAPVTLLLEDGRNVLQYRVADGAAVPLVNAGEKTRRASSANGLVVHVGVSQAWLTDGEWFLLHAAEGAPSEKSTVNAGVTGLHAAAQYGVGKFAASAGVDARWSLGEWHYLDVGDTDLRLRLHPYVGAGLPWLQVTVGAALPWRLGLGARGLVPLNDRFEFTGGALYEVGLPVAREGALPQYEPGDSMSVWGGFGVRLGG
jgi:hypothetical protein